MADDKNNIFNLLNQFSSNFDTFSKSLAKMFDLLSSNVLNISSSSLPISTPSSCESLCINPCTSNSSSPSPVVSAAIHPVIIDSGCSDTAYRLDDVSSLPPPTPSPLPFCITCASGDRVCSVGSTSATFGMSDPHPVHVFSNEDLALSLHSLADFANAGNDCLFTKDGFKFTDASGSVICENV